jgi:4-amino-4-deoxy-L-arabinose transferase-like glycosyltransferase
MIAPLVEASETAQRVRQTPPDHPPLALAAIVAITLLAGALRLWSLRAVPDDPFYDAAVRSMTVSLHNFFFGAIEPGGTIAIDKPPLDTWLQVASTQLFGWGPVALKLPPALAGTFAVPLLYDAVRRVRGRLPGLASALMLAVLPIAVLSSRSDTMDSVAMFLNVAALWLLVRFAQTNRARWCYLAAAAMGLAFNVKVFQGLVCLPALALLAVLAFNEQRLRRLLLSSVVFIVVALSWLTLTLFFPASERPYAIGSTNGSAWNATFVYNGYDRLFGASTQTLLNAQGAAVLTPANNSEAARAQVAIAAPSPWRLFEHNDPLSGLRIGFVLLAALLLGIPALLESVIRARAPDERAKRAFAAAVLTWLGVGFILFSAMARLHPRYAEAFTPAVAAGAGIGLAWALGSERNRRVVLPLAAAALAIYAIWLLGATSPAAVVTVLGALGVVGALVLPGIPYRAWLLGGALALTAVALPLRIAIGLIQDHEYDSGNTGVIATSEVDAISNYIHAHRDGAHYEFVVADPSSVGDLIIHDVQPILSLTSYNQHELLKIHRLAALVASGAVRFAYIGGPCIPSDQLELPRCSAGARWVRAHGVDVSSKIGLPRSDVLYFLPRRYRQRSAGARHANALDSRR